MSDEERTSEQKMATARAALVEVFVNALSDYEVEGMVTGFLMIGEYMGKDGQYDTWWFCGTGSPSEGDTAGLASWRVEGLARKVIRDINERNVSSE